MVANDERGYLVLSRDNYQRITITTPDGQEIDIVSLPRKSGQNRIGVEAPKDFRVVRKETKEKAVV